MLKITPKPPRTGKIGSHGMNEGEVHMQRQNRRWGKELWTSVVDCTGPSQKIRWCVCVFLVIAFSCSKGTDVGNLGPALSLSPQHCVSSSVCCGVVSQLAEFICILYHYCMVWFGCWDCTNMIYPIWLLYGTLLKGERASSVLLIVAFVPPNSRHLAVPLWSGIASSAAGKWGLM